MDGNVLLLVIFWMAQLAFTYRMAYNRGLNDRAGLMEDLTAPLEVNDGTYWRKMYEDLVDELPDSVFNHMDSERDRNERKKTT